MRVKQAEGRSGDDQIVGRTQDLLDKTRARVRVMKKEAELNAKYDDRKVSSTPVKSKVNSKEALQRWDASHEADKAKDQKEDGKKTE